MIESSGNDRQIPLDQARLIGAHGREGSGPLVICVGGIHGNETAGVVAAGRILAHLELGVVKSDPFRMKTSDAPVATEAGGLQN